jgi:transmembrane sensor
VNASDDDNTDETGAAIDEAAADWLVQLSDRNVLQESAMLAAFTRWSEADPRHAQAFARLKETWNAIGDSADSAALAPLRHDARSERARLRRRELRRTVGGYGIGLASAVVVAVVAYLVFWPSVESFGTAIGERRTITLADRSHVELDADSAIAVTFRSDKRLVRLIKGQAFFDVAKDATRPFVVEAQGRTVTATGTAFDVESQPDGLKVTLVHGQVLVGSLGGPVLARLLSGDSLTMPAGQAPRLVHGSNLLALLAWRSGNLIFDDVALGEAVGRMAHYTRTQVVVDPSLAALRISGVFKAGDLAGLVSALTAYYPVVASDGDGTVRLSRRR